MKNVYVAPQVEEFVPVSEPVLLDESPEANDNENNLGNILSGIGIASF